MWMVPVVYLDPKGVRTEPPSLIPQVAARILIIHRFELLLIGNPELKVLNDDIKP